MEKTGDLYEVKGEVSFEWRIKDFSLLEDTIDKRYESPYFCFCGSSWNFRICTNGETKNDSGGWISLYLMRRSSGSPLALDFSIGFKNVDGRIIPNVNFAYVFDQKNLGWGRPKFIERSALVDRKSELMPSDTLTVMCTLENSEQNDVAGSLFCRLQELSDNFKEQYEKAENTDFQLKVNGTNIGAHRFVLETRSSVFAAMFSDDTNESQTGEMSIPDIDKNAVEAILEYMYSGDIGELTTGNVFSLYAAADKYDIKDVREMCLKFIVRNLSVQWVCDVIKFAELHQEEEVNRLARDFFQEHAGDVLETDAWKTLMRENHDIGFELLSTAVKTLFRKCHVK